MARPKLVEITDVNKTIWYVPSEVFELGGIPEDPESVIGNYIHGSRGPMLRVNSMSDMSGEWRYLNPAAIVDMKVDYL